MRTTKRKPRPAKVYVIYDGRAEMMDTDDCAILDVCETELEARCSVAALDCGAVAFVYDLDESTRPASAINERRAW